MILILFKIFEKIMIFQKNNRKILILITVFETISMLVKFLENLDFGQNFRKSWFWSNFMEDFILVKIFESFNFGQKISILVNSF